MQNGAIAIPMRDGFSDINYIYNICTKQEIYFVVPLTAADVTTTTTAIMYHRQYKMYVTLTSSPSPSRYSPYHLSALYII
jgi:hypothetical protein